MNETIVSTWASMVFQYTLLTHTDYLYYWENIDKVYIIIINCLIKPLQDTGLLIIRLSMSLLVIVTHEDTHCIL